MDRKDVSALSIRRCVPAVLCLLLAVLPLIAVNDYQRYVLDVILINTILAVGLNIVKGFAGQVTVGHIALAAVGAYASALVSLDLGAPFVVALAAGMLAAGIAGILVGVPSLRLEGAYLALATLGLAETVRIVIATTDALGGSAGLGNIPPPSLGRFTLSTYTRFYYLAMPLAVFAVYVSFAILQSDTGRAFKALREDPVAAAATGVDVRRYKVLAFVISALYAGCAGALQAHLPPGFIHPDQYTINEMVTVLLMVVLGGLGNVWGGVLGAVIVTVLYELTRGYYEYQLLMFGIAVVVVVMYMPSGLAGLFARRSAVEKFRRLRQNNVRAA